MIKKCLIGEGIIVCVGSVKKPKKKKSSESKDGKYDR